MSATDYHADPAAADSDSRVALVLALDEAEALRAWLLKATANGASSLDEPLVNSVLTALGRRLDEIHAAANVRRELEEAGLDVAHLSDEQVRELAQRIADAARPGL